MCYDWRSSLIAWGISFGIALYLFSRNEGDDRFYAAFIVCFSLIQLFEAMIWVGLERNVVWMVSLGTLLVLVGLCTQPIVQTVGALATTSNKNLHGGYYMFTFVIFIVFMVIASNFVLERDTLRSSVGDQGHLVWRECGVFGTPIAILYLLGLFVPLVIKGLSVKNLTLIFIGLATLIYSLKTTSGKEFGSFWCFTAVFYSIAALVL